MDAEGDQVDAEEFEGCRGGNFRSDRTDSDQGIQAEDSIGGEHAPGGMGLRRTPLPVRARWPWENYHLPQCGRLPTKKESPARNTLECGKSSGGGACHNNPYSFIPVLAGSFLFNLI